jgi:tRNA threonylcarbamoyladenosine biosynthesis protein TsaB
VRVLGIETATMLGGVAVMDDEAGLVAEVRTNVKATHSERLMRELDQMLRRAGLALGDLDALAVSAGPGSFTGLRIGLATAKGLAFATGLPVVAVPTLEAFAWGVAAPGTAVCPMLDARKREVYAGVFRREGDEMARLLPEGAIAPGALAEHLAAYETVLLAGEGAVLYRGVFEKRLGPRLLWAPPHQLVPSPAAVAHLGLRLAARGAPDDAASLSPRYLRKSEAELKGS